MTEIINGMWFIAGIIVGGLFQWLITGKDKNDK